MPANSRWDLIRVFKGLMHLICFIIRIYHDTRSPERQKQQQQQHNNNNNNNNINAGKVEPRYGSRYSDWTMNWTVRGSNCGRGKSVFRRFHKIAKGDYQRRHVCPSVRMEQLSSHWTDFL